MPDRVYNYTTTPLLCECDSISCFRILPVSPDRYKAIQKLFPGSALVMVGHENEGDELLAHYGTYLVVKG